MLSCRNEFCKLLIDIDKEMIRDPTLWAIYDDDPMAHEIQRTPENLAKLRAFANFLLNTFDLVDGYYDTQTHDAKRDSHNHAAWTSMAKKVIERSSIVRSTIRQPIFKCHYTESFCTEMLIMVEAAEKEITRGAES